MKSPNLSFEFFPPRSDAQVERFWPVFDRLSLIQPDYVSMTWGALGSSSQASLDILEPLVRKSSIPVTAHLTCVAQTDESVRAAIARLEQLGISRFLALRGDCPEPHVPGSLANASDLVAILAEDASRDIAVAAYPEGHPEAESLEKDIYWLKHKLDAGASHAVTQFFFSADTFLRFRDAAVAQGITQTLVPGILPVHDIDKVCSFSAKCGAHVPESLIKVFDGVSDKQQSADLAVQECVNLCAALQREGVEDFHFYTLNQSELCSRICSELRGSSAISESGNVGEQPLQPSSGEQKGASGHVHAAA